MSLHLGEIQICEITYVDALGAEVTICEVAIGSLGVFGCPEAPAVQSVELPYTGGVYQFTVGNFTTGFKDPNGDSYSKLKITGLPSIGSVKLGGILVSQGQEMLVSDVTGLTYEFPAGYTVKDKGYADADGKEYALARVGVTFQVSDNSPELLYSNEAVVNLLLTSPQKFVEPNLAPTVGDVNITVDMGTTTPITMSMIRDLSDPRYSDPENDPIAVVRINSIRKDNLGIFYVNNLPIFAGQIIPVADIEAGLFKYVGYNSLSEVPDSFDFSVQDTKGNWSS